MSDPTPSSVTRQFDRAYAALRTTNLQRTTR
jgi:hypothetical protein